jgi:hypothetical protein
VRRRQYTLDDYRRDVARLCAIRRSDAPGVSELLDEALTANAELAAVDVELTVVETELTLADLDLTATDLELAMADAEPAAQGDLALARDVEAPGPISLVRRLRPRTQ